MDYEEGAPSAENTEGHARAENRDKNKVGMSESAVNCSNLEWALAYAQAGFYILILEPESKEPVSGHSWLSDATNDPDVITYLLSQKNEAGETPNWGACPGPGMVWLDLDEATDKKTGAPKDGIAKFEKLELENELLPTTLMQSTPSGGRHIALKVPYKVTNANDFPSGIDVRGSHGYVVGCGSVVDGKTYEVIQGSPDQIAEAPEWVMKRLKAPGQSDPNRNAPLCELDLEENVQLAREFLDRRAPAIQGRGGDEWTLVTAEFCRDFGLSEEKTFELMMAPGGFNSRCDPPWDRRELEQKIKNGFKYGENRPGCKRNLLVDFLRRRAAEAERAFNFVPASFAARQRERDYIAEVLARQECKVAEYRASDREDLFPAYLVGELDQIPDPVWLIRDVLPEISLGMTYGETGSLKTFLEIDKALWGAVGEPWAANTDHGLHGFKVKDSLRTVIVAGEGARGLKRRIAAWAKRHGIKTNDLPILVIPVMPRFADEGDLDKLIRTIKAKLPDPDYVIVDTAMWAASGLNLNVPADSQVLLSSFKRAMLALGCSLTFVHHTGKDKKREQLGAENLIAGVDVADRVDLEEKGTGYRKIKVTNKKMKDGETRELIHMEAYPEMLGTDEDGRKFGSLVLRRCRQSAKAEAEADPRVTLALEIIAENRGKMALNMSGLAEEMARRNTSEELTDGELENVKEGMRNYLRKAATSELAPYAHKAGRAKNAQWLFEDRSGR